MSALTEISCVSVIQCTLPESNRNLNLEEPSSVLVKDERRKVPCHLGYRIHVKGRARVSTVNIGEPC